MKAKKYLTVSVLLPAILFAAACAVDPEENAYRSLDRVMKAWMKVNYPGISTDGESGAYVLEMDPGSGVAVSDSAYVFVHYAKRTLDQTVTSTNIQALSEQLGTYAATTDYSSDIWRLDQGYLPGALEKVIKRMRAGGHAKIALPSSASAHDNTLYTAFNSLSESDNQLIELTLDTVVTDIYDYQERTMKRWFQEHYQVSDTTVEHLYFKKLVEKTGQSDTISEGNSVNVRYIGRLLDGRVFDTNIADTAKFYRIYQSSGSYTALSFNFHKTDEAKLASENNYVSGFSQALILMNYGETAVTLFNSELAYGESGKSPSIPEYAPLFYWLYIEPRD